MNILKKLLSRSGKVALSGVQAAGLAAVVGIAGFGAWQYLSSPADDNTAFNPSQYNSGEIVYVAGGNTGSYGGVNYGAGADGKGGSSGLVSSARVRQYDNRRIALDQQSELEQQEESARKAMAHQMGATEGMGIGANEGKGEYVDNNPLAAFGGGESIAGLKDAVANAKAASQAGGAAGGADGARASSLSGSGSGFGSSKGSGLSAGGNAVNNQFAIQNDGKNRLSESALASLQEGKSFGSSGRLGNSRFARFGKDGKGKGGSDLEWMTKRSAEIAQNDKSANEGSRAFLASTQISGGIMIDGETVNTGSASSSDFSTDTQFQGINDFGKNLNNQDNRKKAGWRLFGALLWRFLVATLLIPLLLGLCAGAGSVLGKILQYALAGLVTRWISDLCFQMFDKVTEFREQFGPSGWDTTVQVLVGIVGVLTATAWGGSYFIPSGKIGVAMSMGFSQHMNDLMDMFGIEFSEDSDASRFAKQSGTDKLKELADEFRKAKEEHEGSN